MPQVSQASVPLAGQAQIKLSQAQNSRVSQRSELRSRVLERVDQLVRGMETVAQRLSSDGVSTAQRSLLVARFNDLQRRVNEIDGVVGSEGRADAVAPSGTPLALEVGDSRSASRAVRELSKMREDRPIEVRAVSTRSPAGGERGQVVDIIV